MQVVVDDDEVATLNVLYSGAHRLGSRYPGRETGIGAAAGQGKGQGVTAGLAPLFLCFSLHPTTHL